MLCVARDLFGKSHTSNNVGSFKSAKVTSLFCAPDPQEVNLWLDLCCVLVIICIKQDKSASDKRQDTEQPYLFYWLVEHDPKKKKRKTFFVHKLYILMWFIKKKIKNYLYLLKKSII